MRISEENDTDEPMSNENKEAKTESAELRSDPNTQRIGTASRSPRSTAQTSPTMESSGMGRGSRRCVGIGDRRKTRAMAKSLIG